MCGLLDEGGSLFIERLSVQDHRYVDDDEEDEVDEEDGEDEEGEETHSDDDFIDVDEI